MRLSAGLLVAAAAACSSQPSVEDAVDRYRDALRRRDVETLWALSDARFRSQTDKQALADFIRAHPEEAERLLQSLEGPQEIRAQQGGLTLVLVDGEWRISGGLIPHDASSPQAAVETFFWSVDAKRWDVLRSVMPVAEAERLGTDQALERHLEQMAGRIAAARTGLLSAPSPASIEGDRATIRYGEKAAKLVKEAGRWKILDLE